jgi:hypothetical protein
MLRLGVADAGPETLLELFTRYNNDLWPVHVVAYLLAVPLVWAVATQTPSLRVRRMPALLLGILLIWLGVVFQGLYATDVSRSGSRTPCCSCSVAWP